MGLNSPSTRYLITRCNFEEKEIYQRASSRGIKGVFQLDIGQMPQFEEPAIVLFCLKPACRVALTLQCTENKGRKAWLSPYYSADFTFVFYQSKNLSSDQTAVAKRL